MLSQGFSPATQPASSGVRPPKSSGTTRKAAPCGPSSHLKETAALKSWAPASIGSQADWEKST
ncbi:hypothetical protein SGLAM104S_00254 [Streptomyces glaucescens]